MLSWASQQIEKISEKVAPPPQDAAGRYVYAMQRKDEEGALLALDEMPDAAHAVVQSAKGSTALHVACQACSARVIRHLLTQVGASLQALDNFGNTPLHYACMSTDKQAVTVVKMLVTEFGASVVVKNGENKTPYDLAAVDGVRQYLLPLQLQQETQHALDNGGVGLPPGIDLGGLRINRANVAPPPIMGGGGGYSSAPPTASSSPATPYQVQQQANMLTTPSPTAAATAKPPTAPSSGNREYARSGSSSAAVYTGGAYKPDGFHSSSSDRNLQKLYNHADTSRAMNVAPPPRSGNSAPTSLASTGGLGRLSSVGRYPVYDAVSGRTTSGGSIGGGAPSSLGAYPTATPPHSGNVFNPVAVNPAFAAPAAATAPVAAPAPASQGSTSQPEPLGDLPEGWTQMADPASGRTYYYNAAQNLTTWDRPQAAPPTGLPEGWTEAMDPASGRSYFVNAAQGITTWERPTGATAATTAATETKTESTATAETKTESAATEEPMADAKPEEPAASTEMASESKPESKPEEPATAAEPTAESDVKPEEPEATKETTTEPEATKEESKSSAPPSNGLPDGWTEVMDPASGRPYFVNAAQNVTTWERPTVTPASEPTAAPEQKVEKTQSSEDVFATPPAAEKEESAETNDVAAVVSTDTAKKSKSAEDLFATPHVAEKKESPEDWFVVSQNTEKEYSEKKDEEPKVEPEPEKEPVVETTQTEDAKDSVTENASDVVDKTEPSAAEALPEGWVEATDPASGRIYYHNAAQNITTWERPPNLPEGWAEVIDPASGRPYYVNAAQNITSWERPSAPPMPAQQPVSNVASVSSTASAEELFANPSPTKPAREEPNLTTSNTDEQAMPKMRSITDDTAMTSSSTAAELFASPAAAAASNQPAINGAADEVTNSSSNTSSAAEPTAESSTAATPATAVKNENAVGDSPEEMSEVPLDAAPDAKVAKETTQETNGVGDSFEEMSEVPLDETPTVKREPFTQESSTTGATNNGETDSSLFSAIGLPPPPFRSGQ